MIRNIQNNLSKIQIFSLLGLVSQTPIQAMHVSTIKQLMTCNVQSYKNFYAESKSLSINHNPLKFFVYHSAECSKNIVGLVSSFKKRKIDARLLTQNQSALAINFRINFSKEKTGASLQNVKYNIRQMSSKSTTEFVMDCGKGICKKISDNPQSSAAAFTAVAAATATAVSMFSSPLRERGSTMVKASAMVAQHSEDSTVATAVEQEKNNTIWGQTEKIHAQMKEKHEESKRLQEKKDRIANLKKRVSGSKNIKEAYENPDFENTLTTALESSKEAEEILWKQNDADILVDNAEQEIKLNREIKELFKELNETVQSLKDVCVNRSDEIKAIFTTHQNMIKNITENGVKSLNFDLDEKEYSDDHRLNFIKQFKKSKERFKTSITKVEAFFETVTECKKSNKFLASAREMAHNFLTHIGQDNAGNMRKETEIILHKMNESTDMVVELLENYSDYLGFIKKSPEILEPLTSRTKKMFDAIPDRPVFNSEFSPTSFSNIVNKNR